MQNIFKGDYIISKCDYPYLQMEKLMETINDLPNSSNSWSLLQQHLLEIIIPISQFPFLTFKISPFSFSE